MNPQVSAEVSHLHHSGSLATFAIACVVDESIRAERRPLIRGLSHDSLTTLIQRCSPEIIHFNATPSLVPPPIDEFDDLVALLQEHLDRQAPPSSEYGAWLAHAVATAAMGENHLWQDMGLPSRKVLSELMTTYFPTLAAKNVGDMKWKKFFYRQLCINADVLICKSPNCADCTDYKICFGPEN